MVGLQEMFEGVRLGDFARAFRGGFEGAAGPVKDIVDQLMEWGTHLTKNATAKWLPIVLGNHQCEVDCDAQALVRCESCRRYCCLAHARIDYGANASCSVCVMEFAGTTKQAPPRRQRVEKPMNVAKAFRAMGVPQTSTLNEVRMAYLNLAKKWHPDKARTEKSRLKHEEKMKRLNEAHRILLRHLEKEAA